MNEARFITAQQALYFAVVIALDAEAEEKNGDQLSEQRLLRVAEVWAQLAVALATIGPLDLSSSLHRRGPLFET